MFGSHLLDDCLFALLKLTLHAALLEILLNYASCHANNPIFLGKIGLFALIRALFFRPIFVFIILRQIKIGQKCCEPHKLDQKSNLRGFSYGKI
jgi:hypothetical protein